MKARKDFRRMLAEPGILVQPAIATPFAAKLAEAAGVKCLALGGFAMGANQTITEPLLSVDEVARMTRQVTEVTDLPLMVDAGAGWGEPVHVMRTVRVLEQAGASSIHIEDQHYPKRASYHKGIEEIISAEEMVEKVRAAVEARIDPDFVLVVRTDAMRTHGYDEAIRRAHIFREAGADMIKMFPRNLEEAKRVPKDLPDIPLVYVTSTGNKRGWAVLSAQQAEGFGYKVLYDAISATNATAKALQQYFETLVRTGESGFDPVEVTKVREHFEKAMGLQKLYEIEATTSARILAAQGKTHGDDDAMALKLQQKS